MLLVRHLIKRLCGDGASRGCAPTALISSVSNTEHSAEKATIPSRRRGTRCQHMYNNYYKTLNVHRTEFDGESCTARLKECSRRDCFVDPFMRRMACWPGLRDHDGESKSKKLVSSTHGTQCRSIVSSPTSREVNGLRKPELDLSHRNGETALW